MNPTAYLNGQWLPLDQAHVSVLDRGFIFGDGIYELIPVYAKKPFRLDAHLARLEEGLQAIQLTNPYSRQTWQALITQLIATQSFNDQGVYIQVTRGVAPRDHAFPPADTPPTVFLMSQPLPVPHPNVLAQGIKAITAEDIRWSECHIKATSLLANVLLRQMAVQQGVQETLLIRDQHLIEGSVSSAFIVHAGMLLTPPPSRYMLPGITYEVVLELAQRHQIAHEVRPIHESLLTEASEIWITSSSKEIQAVVELNGKPVGNGKPGPVFAKMSALYSDFKQGLQNA